VGVSVNQATAQFVFSHSTVSTISTASFTPPAGSRLWAMAFWDSHDGIITITSSPSLTWTQVVQPSGGATGGDVVVSYADVPSGGWTGTVTATVVPAPSFSGASLYVMPVTGGEATPGGAVVTGTSGQVPSIPITSTQNGSLLIAAAANWSAVTQWTLTGAPDAANESMLKDHTGTNADDYFSSQYEGFAWRWNSTPAAGSYTLDLGTGQAGGDCVAIEIRSGTAKTIAQRGDSFPVTGTSSLAVTVPTVVAGDVMLLYAATNSGATPAAPAGWELVQRQVNGTTISGSLFARVSDGTEGGNTVTVTGLATHSVGFMQSFSNCDVNVPTIAAGASWLGGMSARANASGTKGSTSVTPSADHCMIILSDQVVAGTTHSAWQDGNGNTLTEGFSDGGDGTISSSNAMLVQGTLQATGVGTWSQTVNGAGVGMWVVLVPDTTTAAGGGGGPTNPTVAVELWENGAFVQTLQAATNLTAEGVLSFRWDASVLADPTGAGVELRIVGASAGIDVGAIEWLDLYAPSTGGPKAIAGASAGVSTVGADVTAAYSLTGSSASLSTASGDIAATHPVAGSSASVSSAAASLGLLQQFAGAPAGTSTASGNLAVAHPLAGSSAAVGTASGGATAAFALVATSSGASTVAAAVTATYVFAGSSAGVSTTSATEASTETFVGSSASTSTVSGNLAVAHPLAGATTGTTAVGGDVVIAHPLAGSSAGVSTVAGGAAVGWALAAATVGTSTTAANVAVVHPLAASSAGTATVAGAAVATWSLAASANSVSTVIVDVAATYPLFGESDGLSTVVADTAVLRALAATTVGTSSSVADLGLILGFTEAWGMVLV
jgi:trimeric autotransporter adhesin